MIWKNLHNSIEAHSEKEALIFQDHRITYRELGEIINRLANGLKNAGIEKGDRVALMLPNLPHFVFSYFAGLQIGAQIVPINYLMELDDLNHVLTKVEPKAIIFWDKFRNLLHTYFSAKNNSLLRIVLGRKANSRELSLTHLIASSDASFLEEEVAEEETGVIQFTAGTSGQPQGAVLSHASIVKSYQGLTNFFRFSDSDVFLAILPLVLAVSQNALMNVALMGGGTLVLMPKLELEHVLQAIPELGVTTIVGSPKFFKKLAHQEIPFDSHKLKNCLSVNNLLEEETRNLFAEKFGVPLLNSYAVTEAGGIVAAMHPSSFNPPESLGMVLPHAEIQLFQESGELLPVGEKGELLIRGDGLFSGYWRNEELTEQRLHDGWFHTDDIGRKDVDGIVYLIERKCNIILKSGFQILASEIEKILLLHPKVKEAAIIPIPHPEFKEDLKAYIVTSENSLTKDELIEFCKQKFPIYMCPSQIEFRKHLPKTRMGRISKRKLKSEVWI